MPEMERKVIWELMIPEEGRGKIPVIQTYTEAGFDPNKDLLQSYAMLGGDTHTEYERGGLRQRMLADGGLLVDWNLMTTLDGLYAAGDQVFGGAFHHHAAATGRYAGRKAADYAKKATERVAERSQIEAEKNRVYAPLKRKDGIEWKELNAGISQVMQNYCCEPKTEELLNIGSIWLKDIEQNEASQAYATNPHKLGRTIDVLDILTNSQIIINACLARKASSKYLHFNRLDYPKVDPPEWNKWLPIRLENEEVKVGELSIDFWGDLTENYEIHNKDYNGWYTKK
jgi:succinate dehydrogenase/fumarate reductase flavoprotein subunit